MIISRHRRQQNPAPAQPASPSPTPHPQPRKRRKPQNSWVMPWILQREETGCCRTLLDELITTDIPGYRNYTRMEPAFEYFIVHDNFKTQKAAEPSTCPASITITHPPPPTQKEKKATEFMGHALDTAERRDRLLQNTLG